MEMMTKQLPAFSSQQQDMLDIYLLYHFIDLSVCCAGGWVERWLLQSLAASQRVNPATRWSLPLCFLSHPSQNTPKGTQPG